MLTLCALGLIKPSTQGLMFTLGPKGLMFTFAHWVKLNPVPKGLMSNLCALG